MIKLLTVALLGLLGITAPSYPQEIPNVVKEYMFQLQNDPTVEYGFDYAKERRYINQNVKFQDWYVGLPFQFYNLKIEKIEIATEDTKFEDVIEPTSKWCIPIKINNDSYLYHVNITVFNEGFKPAGGGEDVIGFKTWDKVRKKFPEESEIRPIFVDYPFQLLYFPHKKNGKNIFYARNPKWNDLMSISTSKSLDNLDDGKTIVPLLKDKMKVYKEQRKKLEKQKEEFDNFRDTSGGKK